MFLDNTFSETDVNQAITVSANTGNYMVGGQPIYNWWIKDYVPNYYPHYNTITYPVIEDKGKKAYEIAKGLMDKKLVVVTRVKQFTELMDELMKIL